MLKFATVSYKGKAALVIDCFSSTSFTDLQNLQLAAIEHFL